jgi:hypothetical protein
MKMTSVRAVGMAALMSGIICLIVPIALAQPVSGQPNGHEQWQGYGNHHRDPEIHRGMRLLHRARQVLNRGAHDFGGHRAAAVEQIDQALNNLQLALRVRHNGKELGRKGPEFHRGGTRLASAEGYGRPRFDRDDQGMGRSGQEHHPDIRTGLRLCKRARDVLQHAAHDFDGHRAAAVQNVDQAIAQLQEALRYDKN